jgi:hypothetical protein
MLWRPNYSSEPNGSSTLVLGDVRDVDQAVLQVVTTNISPQQQRIIALGRGDGSFSPRSYGHASSPGYCRLRWASWSSVAGGRFPAFSRAA